jgi:hypothetical protein
VCGGVHVHVCAVCKSVGAADRAFATFLDMKRQGQAPDVRAVGALLATFAEAMQAST